MTRNPQTIDADRPKYLRLCEVATYILCKLLTSYQRKDFDFTPSESELESKSTCMCRFTLAAVALISSVSTGADIGVSCTVKAFKASVNQPKNSPCGRNQKTGRFPSFIVPVFVNDELCRMR